MPVPGSEYHPPNTPAGARTGAWRSRWRHGRRRVRHEEDRGDHPAGAAAGRAGRARRARRVGPDRQRGGGLRAPEGLHRAVPRLAGQHLAAAEDQGRVGGAGRASSSQSWRRRGARRAHRARSATAACSSTRSSRRCGSGPASAARRPCGTPRRRTGATRARPAPADPSSRAARAAPSAPAPEPSRASPRRARSSPSRCASQIPTRNRLTIASLPAVARTPRRRWRARGLSSPSTSERRVAECRARSRRRAPPIRPEPEQRPYRPGVGRARERPDGDDHQRREPQHRGADAQAVTARACSLAASSSVSTRFGSGPKPSVSTRSSSGMRACTRVPAPGALSTSSLPSSAPTRSARPCRPEPSLGVRPAHAVVARRWPRSSPSHRRDRHGGAARPGRACRRSRGTPRRRSRRPPRPGRAGARRRLATTSTGIEARPARSSSAAGRPRLVRIAGWMPRARSRRSLSASPASSPALAHQLGRLGIALLRRASRPSAGSAPARRGAAERRRAGRARSAGARRRRPR